MVNLDNSLAALEGAQLLRRLAEPDLTYIFKHALTHEVAYHSLLKSERKRLHRRLAQVFEGIYADRSQEISDVLAYHWEKAEIPDRARYYLFVAGKNAARRYANQEALGHFDRALAFSESASPQEVMAIRETRAEVYEFLSRYTEALADYEIALKLVRQIDILPDECRIMARMAWLYWLDGEGVKAVQIAQETQFKARALTDRSIALRAYLVEGLVSQAEGRISIAYPRLRQALFSSRASDERALEGESLFYLGIQNNFMGRFARASACAEKAYRIKKQLGDRVGEVVSLYLKARAETGRGNYDAALAALEAGRAIAEEIQNPFGLAQYPNTRAWLCAELGDWETAYELDRAGLQVAQVAPVRPPEIATLINLVLDCTALGKFEEAKDYVRKLEQWMGRAEFGFHAWRWETRLADARARLFLAESRNAEAALAISELLEWADRTRSRKYLARGLLLRGQLNSARNDSMEAEENFIAARELADTLQYIPVRVRARLELIKIDEQGGTSKAAVSQRHQVTALIAEVMSRIKTHDLARSFDRGLGRSLDSASNSKSGNDQG